MPSSGADTAAGRQIPTAKVEPYRLYTDGPQACDLAAAYIAAPDEWQSLVLDCWLGRGDAGELTAMTCGLSSPRQNGKNYILEAFELNLLLNVPDTHILHTAHQVRTEKRAFNRLASIFNNGRHPELRAEVESIRRTNGEESIRLVGGNTIEYSSRARGTARGFDAITVVIYDEAQELTDEQVEALMSTLAASPTGDRQTVYAGTPPSPTAPGTVFKRVREAALQEQPPAGMAWHEWGIRSELCPIEEGMSYGEVRPMVLEANPAMGTRLDDGFTEQEFAIMTPAGFARERLGWWDTSITRYRHAVEDPADWGRCAVEAPPGDGKMSFGVKFAPEGDRAAIAVCMTPDGGDPFVELVDDIAMPNGLERLAGFLAERGERTAAIAIDGKSYMEALAKALLNAGVTRRALMLCGSQDVTTAASMFAIRVAAHTVQHIGTDGGDMLSLSVTGSSRREIGSRGAWGFGDGDARSYPAEAATLALWANETTRRDPTGGGMDIW